MMNLSHYKGLIGELATLKDCISKFEPRSSDISIDDLWMNYVYLQTKGSRILGDVEIMNGALANNTMDYMIREPGKSWRFLEVKASSWPGSTKFHLQPFQGEYLEEPTSTLAVVRLPEITKVEMDRIPEYLDASVIEYYRRDEYSIGVLHVFIKDFVRRGSNVTERRP